MINTSGKTFGLLIWLDAGIHFIFTDAVNFRMDCQEQKLSMGGYVLASMKHIHSRTQEAMDDFLKYLKQTHIYDYHLERCVLESPSDPLVWRIKVQPMACIEVFEAEVELLATGKFTVGFRDVSPLKLEDLNAPNPFVRLVYKLNELGQPRGEQHEYLLP